MDLRAPEKMRDFLENSPSGIIDSLVRVSKRSGASLYLVGGSVRDWLLGRITHDVDVVADSPVLPLAKLLRDELGGGTLVDLSGPDDEVIRLVWQGEQVDFSTFRAGVKTLEEDLCLRDFTVNALAVVLTERDFAGVLDPTGGMIDLQAKRVKHCPGAFAADPVRMLRGYRLAATLGFCFSAETREEVRQHARLITGVAAERIGYEMKLIFASTRTAETLAEMAETGLLRWLLPELYEAEGVEQPEFHHLDVLGHSFLALKMMEEIIARPSRYFGEKDAGFAQYLAQENSIVCLKWAALMHDVGKPITKNHSENGRVTFYAHDEEGRRIFQQFAERCRWSKEDTERTSGLIGMHMHPFHLCNLQRETGRITRRAALKLCRRAGDDLPGLFLLAMADSLASSGEKKPERMEEELTVLFNTVRSIYDEYIAPILRGPRLISGRDLIESFNLTPSPLFAEILEELEMARIEGQVVDRQSALAWVEAYLHRNTPV